MSKVTKVGWRGLAVSGGVALSGVAAFGLGADRADASGRSDSASGTSPTETHIQAHARTARAARRFVRTPAGRAEARRARRWERLSRVRPLPEPRRARASVDGPAEEIGSWAEDARFTLPTPAIHTAVLPTGKVLFFSERAIADNSTRAYLYDPRGGALKRVDPPIDPRTGQPANIWCAGQSFLADGRLLVAGGNLAYPNKTAGKDFAGLNHVYTFNPFNETWTRQPDMRHGRWYPTQTLQPNGETLIQGGTDETGVSTGTAGTNKDVEIFVPSRDMDGRGTVKLVTPSSGTAPPNQGLYPHQFLMPSGRTVVAGPDTRSSWFFQGVPAGSTFGWTDAANPTRTRTWGSAVLVPQGPAGSTRVMQVGGAGYDKIAHNSAETYDEATNRWSAAPSLKIGRAHHNTVQLPDGNMVTVGGGVGSRAGTQFAFDPPQQQIELYDATTGAWRLGPAQREGRAYHSTAVLLPDARVLSAGDNSNGGKLTDTGEIYRPPYLFKGARPTISSAPSEIGHGNGFDVGTPDADVSKAVLIAPAATTHAADMSQRAIPLGLAKTDSGVRLTAPASTKIAPPGYYMLFLLNERGVPSVSRFVRLGADVAPPAEADTQSPTAPSGLSATAASSTRVDLSWTAASDNVAVTGYDVLRDGVGIGTATGTGYSDTTAAASTSYSYTVRARDGAGNVGPASGAASATTPAPPSETTTTLAFPAVADARVQESTPTTNYGQNTSLATDIRTGVRIHSYLRFTVSGIAPGQTVKQATLALKVKSGQTAPALGPALWRTTGDWAESTITWNSGRPARSGTEPAGVFATAVLGTRVEAQVAGITGNGTYSFELAPRTTDDAYFTARESTTVADRPQLDVTVSG